MTINPVNGPNDPLNLNADLSTDQTTARVTLNVSTDTLASLQTSSVGMVTDPSKPNLTLFNFLSQIATTLREAKESDQSFNTSDAANWKDFHRNISLSGAQLRAVLTQVETFKDDWNSYVNRWNNAISGINSALVDIGNYYGNNITPAYNDLIAAVNALNTAATGTQAQTDALINTYNNALATLNSRLSTYNNSNNLQQIKNNANIIYGLLGERTALMNTRNGLGVSPSLLPDLPVPNFMPNTSNLFLGIFALPPYPPGLFFDPGRPELTSFRASISPPTINLPIQAIVTTTPTAPTLISDEVGEEFKTVYIAPLKQAIKDSKKSLDRVDESIKFQEKFRTKFGQATIGLIIDQPQGNKAVAPGQGSGVAISDIGGQSTSLTSKDSKFSASQLQALIQSLDANVNSAIPEQFANFSDDILTALAVKAVPEAVQLSQGATVGASAESSPVVTASVALASLTEAVGLVSSDAIFELVLKQLQADPALVSIPLGSEASVEKGAVTLEGLARGIASALNLQVLKNVILQVEAALGLSGLVPQLLASLGSVSIDDISKLVNGQINYKNLFESPFSQELVKIALKDALLKSSSLSEQQAEIAIQSALRKLESQGPFGSDSAAQAALKQNILDQLSDQNIAASTIDEGFQSLEPTVVRNDDLTDENITLTPQQQLDSELKTAAFNDDLKASLIRSNLEREDAEKIAARVEAANSQSASIELRNQISVSILDEEGVDNARDIVASAASTADTSLKTPIFQEAVPLPILTEDFAREASAVLTKNGVRAEVADTQSEKYAALIFNNPTSIKSLVDDNLKEYAKAVGISQSEAAEENFKDAIEPTYTNTAEDRGNPAYAAVFAANPNIGDSGHKVGTAGGVSVNPANYV